MVVGSGYRGVYNSAWIGALMSVCCSTFLSLVGFYVVKNSIQRDVDTRVGRILAATPMRKSFYTVAKTLSNFAVLAAMVVVLMLAAVVMQLLRAEVQQISLWKLWAPFLFAALPAMAITAAVAVLFETLPILRGGVGNVIYFFAWTVGLGISVTGMNDPIGLQVFYRSMHDALKKIDPATKESFSLTIGGEHAVRTFDWTGVDWTAHIITMRVLWVLVAVGLAFLASALFDRFDPAYERSWAGAGRAAMPPAHSTPAQNGEAAAVMSTSGIVGTSHATSPAGGRVAIAAAHCFGAAPDVERPALVVVCGGRRIICRPVGVSHRGGSSRRSGLCLAMAGAGVVADGLARGAVCYAIADIFF